MRALRPLPYGLRRRHFLALRLGRFVLAAALVLLAPGGDAYAAVSRVSALKPGVFTRLPGVKTGPSNFSAALKTAAAGLALPPRADAGPGVGQKLDVLSETLAPELKVAASASVSHVASLSAGRRVWNLFYGGRDLAGSGDGTFAAGLADGVSGSGLKKSADELADLVKDPPAAVFFDYDGTLTDRRPDGMSAPTPDAVLAGIVRLLEAGIPVGFVTARSLDSQPKTDIPMELWTVLIGRIPKGLRHNVFFSGRVGGELVVFDEAGEPVRLLDGDWLAEEKAKIAAGVASAMAEAGVREGDVEIVAEPGQTSIVFNTHEHLAEMYSMALADKFRAAGLPFQVLQHRNWVYFSRSTKERGVQLLYAHMLGRGFRLAPKDLLFVGDQLKMNPGVPAGGDASMALAFKGSRAISVGDSPGDVLPPNVRRLETGGSEGSLRVIEAVLRGLAARPKMSLPLLERPAVKQSGKLLAVASFVWALSHPAFAAAAGTAALTVLGVPQLVKNFREGAGAVKSLSLDSALIWLSAAALLTAVTVIGGSHWLFILGNVFGTVQALILTGQIVHHRAEPGMRAKALAVAGLLALGILGGAALSPALVASWGLKAALVLLLLINLPQIRMNHGFYAREKRVPPGIAPLYPLLVWGGSLFQLIAAVHLGDHPVVWNAVGAILPTSLVLAQLFFPKQTFAVLEGLMKPLRRLWKRDAGAGDEPYDVSPTTKKFLRGKGSVLSRYRASFASLEETPADFKEMTDVFTTKGDADALFARFVALSPKEAWTGSTAFDLLYEPASGTVYDRSSAAVPPVREGGVVLLTLKVLGALKLTTSFQIVKIDAKAREVSFSYLTINKARGVQRVRFEQKGDEVVVTHISRFRSDSKFRDAYLYAPIHRRLLRDFYTRVFALIG